LPAGLAAASDFAQMLLALARPLPRLTLKV
jgi:hypothetical protein